ncbi:hypothetical protein BDY21DRAFT_424135 [Lineolata rhizophorae]|uniref:BTB domain-containing protein n=1 Tax=Lineolata rhizophorae TaxID=578093 RepID=A0A6A6NQK5_9PEZI|nr:hypothetical protein BDY21DRAFT_424135 [Lineolata rhizophorae]
MAGDSKKSKARRDADSSMPKKKARRDTDYSVVKKKDEFLMYSDGDVSVRLAGRSGFMLQLHSHVLKNTCPFFQRELVSENQCTPSRGVPIKWRFELKCDTKEDLPGELEIILKDSQSHMPSVGPATTENKDQQEKVMYENNMPAPMHLQIWKSVIGALYHRNLDGQPSNLGGLLEWAFGVLDVSDYLGTSQTISTSVNVWLLGLGQTALRAIASAPCEWINLAIRLRSELLYKEAFIHTVGQWNGLDSSLKACISPDILQLIKERLKADEEAKRAFDTAMVGWIIDPLTREPKGGKRKYMRTSYANDILTWIAQRAWTEWAAKRVASGMTWCAVDGGFSTYNALMTGEYLGDTEMAEFHKRFPFSPKGIKRIRIILEHIKEIWKPAMRAKLRSRSQLDTSKFQIHYLTNIKVPNSAIPWLRAEALANQASIAAAIADKDSSDSSGDDDEDYYNLAEVLPAKQRIPNYDSELGDDEDLSSAKDDNEDAMDMDEDMLSVGGD